MDSDSSPPGIGALDLPGDARWFSRYTAALRFLEAVQTTYPEVFQELAVAAPRAGEWVKRCRVKARELLTLEPGRSRERAAELADRYLAGKICQQWARSHHLVASSILDIAETTLRRWVRDDGCPRTTWLFTSDSVMPVVDRDPIFPDPLHEDKKGFLRRANDLWKSQTDLLKASEYQPVTITRESDHFVWLARVQVGGERYQDIQDSLSQARGPDAVRVAVDRLARIIGLELREQPLGAASHRA